MTLLYAVLVIVSVVRSIHVRNHGLSIYFISLHKLNQHPPTIEQLHSLLTIQILQITVFFMNLADSRPIKENIRPLQVVNVS